MSTTPILRILRDARLFVRRPDAMERLTGLAQRRALAADQLFHPEGEVDLVLRRGRVRVAEFLDDGREVGRAVLQSGSCCEVRGSGEGLPLSVTTILALGPAEFWLLPPGTLAGEGVGPRNGDEVKR